MSLCATITMYTSRNENNIALHSEKTEKLWLRSSSATPAKKRNTSISVMSRTSTTSFAGRVSSSFWQAESAALAGNLATSMRVVHQSTASTHLASAAASTASLNACGVRLHWLMMKLNTMVILEYIGFASSFSKRSRSRATAQPRPSRPFQFMGASVSSLQAEVYKRAYAALPQRTMLRCGALKGGLMKHETAVMEQAMSLRTGAYWMPFTHNRYFKKNPQSRILARAEGAYSTTTEGRRLFDCISGMWCCPLGHGHPKIAEAVARQVKELDYSPAFQMGHPKIFSLAERIVRLAPAGMGQVFFANSGSEAVDTALKIAVAYHRVKGDAARTRLIGRERGYHGVGIGGISVGGIAPNRKMFAPLLLAGVDHLPHTYNAAEMAFSRGQPRWGAHLADELERLVALHDASTIAAVIV